MLQHRRDFLKVAAAFPVVGSALALVPKPTPLQELRRRTTEIYVFGNYSSESDFRCDARALLVDKSTSEEEATAIMACIVPAPVWIRMVPQGTETTHVLVMRPFAEHDLEITHPFKNPTRFWQFLPSKVPPALL